MLRPRHAILALLLALLPVCAPAQDDGEVDHLALASLMLRDGNLDRALAALDQYDAAAEGAEGPEWVRYHTLRGMIYMRRNEFEAAREALTRATASGEAEAVVYVYLAQVNYQLEDYAGAVAALDAAGAVVERIPSVYHMRAQCHWLSGEKALAIATLDQASAIFPADASFQRRKVFYLVDLGLFKEAVVQGRQYLERSEGRLEDHVAIGNALRASGELEEAARFLEQARLAFPDSAEVRKVLAHVYIDRGQLGAAADLLYQAALLDPGLMAEAAELYRRSGQAFRALNLNGQLSDQEEKLRQRLALFLELGNFEQAAAMEAPLRRVGLLEDEDLRYAVAYAFFKTGDFEAAEKQLAQLERADLFRKAAELRRAIQDCREESWRCL